MHPKISLCIPTYNRYEKFLKKNIDLYLENPYIDEIIISDETGEDIELLKYKYTNEPKLKLFKNEKILGAFLNKNKAVSYAKNEWVCLIDSDNYAPESYFKSWLEYINHNGIDNKTIYMPIGTIPQQNHNGFDYEMFQDMKINKKNISYFSFYEDSIFLCLLNTGNYIFNKTNYLESNYINSLHDKCKALDVFFKNLLLLINDSKFIIVPNMMYNHIVHDDSYYIKTSDSLIDIDNIIRTLYMNISQVYHFNYKMTLKNWQNKTKQIKEILYNCSEFKYKNDEWVSFPIGMGWSFINYPNKLDFIGEHSRLVLCSINSETDQIRRPFKKNRKSILENLENNNILNYYLETSNYFDSLKKYKFIISPEGNGIDCHRHYESLIYGCIPIVEDNPLLREKYKDLPILFTNDYSEITEKYLNEKYEIMLNQLYDFSKLFLSNYNREEQREIKTNGNYWSLQLSGKKWYDTFI